MRKYLLNCYSDSHSLKPTPTAVHLPMEIVVSHAEQKVYDNKMTQEQASSVTKITTIPLSSDNQTIVSCPSSMGNCHENNQANHQQQQPRPDKVVDHQHLPQPNRLSSLLSLSLPSLISTPNLPCVAQRQSGQDQAMATYQQMRSFRIREQQQSDSFVVVGLLSHSADCYYTGDDVEQFDFLDSTVNDVGSSLAGRSASP